VNSLTTVESRSGQFLVTGVRPDFALRTPPSAKGATNHFLRLEPAAVAVTAERVKEALLRELGVTDQWRGRIRITLKVNAPPNGPTPVNSEWFTDGWQFQVLLPHFLEPERLVRALVRAVLLERANRDNASTRLGDTPLWLEEGLHAQLLATKSVNLILETQTMTVLSERVRDPFEKVRQRLRSHAAYAFSDLCMPSATQLAGAGWDHYRASAQVFVAELLKLKDGRACLQEFFRELPNFLNSELAFLRAFHPHFRGMLDVEKWWSVALVNFTGRDQHLRWTVPVSLQRLDEILQAQVEIRSAANALPSRSGVSLQKLIEQSGYRSQRETLGQIITQLQLLRFSSPPDLAKLVSDYITALQTYVQRSDQAGSWYGPSGLPTPQARAIIRNVVQQLDLLDVIRGDFRKYDPEATGADGAR
jgi:hypothetical protein